jgi:hypothetical protein
LNELPPQKYERSATPPFKEGRIGYKKNVLVIVFFKKVMVRPTVGVVAYFFLAGAKVAAYGYRWCGPGQKL